MKRSIRSGNPKENRNLIQKLKQQKIKRVIQYDNTLREFTKRPKKPKLITAKVASYELV